MTVSESPARMPTRISSRSAIVRQPSRGSHSSGTPVVNRPSRTISPTIGAVQPTSRAMSTSRHSSSSQTERQLLLLVSEDPGHDACSCDRETRNRHRTGAPTGWIRHRVGPPQLLHLLLERPDPLRVRRRGPSRSAVVDVGLAHPRAHRLDPVAQLVSDSLHRALRGPQLLAKLANHPHRLGLLLGAVPTRRRLPRCPVLRHDSILVSKVWSLQPTQGGSVHRPRVVTDRRDRAAPRALYR
jgi:hypothetical protein